MPSPKPARRTKKTATPPPKARCLTDTLRGIMSVPSTKLLPRGKGVPGTTIHDMIIGALVNGACNGDAECIRIIFDRLDGPPTEAEIKSALAKQSA